MTPLLKVAIAVGVLAMGAVTVTLVAFAGLGVWLLAVTCGGLLGIAATLTAVERSDARSSRRPRPGVDPVTGLPELEQLTADLAQALTGPRHVLVQYALDGLKPYRDAYGEQCGDALLAWLAQKLRGAIGDHRAYRCRGASFAMLAAGSRAETDQLQADASAALFEVGHGFAVWSSVGVVILPLEAGTPEEALERADRRAHSPRASAHVGPDPCPPSDPITVLSNIRPRQDIGELAKRVGRRLGVQAERLDALEVAAHLRDVGNVALPTSVLMHPGELPSREWSFIELHTIVGERLLASRFGMEHPARIVRSSHERWDGAGYPDGLRSDQIPLESRIVFVCVAYQEMTSERHGRGGDEAVRELLEAAGTQYDPQVVAALRRELADASTSVLGGDGDASVREPESHDGTNWTDDPPQRRMRVLVADPDPVSRFLLRRGVGSAGHECVAVEDGLSAWETYQRARPDAVIAAAEMAQIDGLELCKRIRRGPAPDAYLILLGDEGDDDRVGRSARAGADACIDRPIVRHDLQVQLDGARQVTERRRADAEATG